MVARAHLVESEAASQGRQAQVALGRLALD